MSFVGVRCVGVQVCAAAGARCSLPSSFRPATVPQQDLPLREKRAEKLLSALATLQTRLRFYVNSYPIQHPISNNPPLWDPRGNGRNNGW